MNSKRVKVQCLLGVCFELAEGYAAVLVVCSHLLPLLDLGHACSGDCCLCVCYSLARRHIANLNERDGYETRAAQSCYRLCDKPLRVGLRNDYNGLALLCLELVGSFCLEVVDDDAVDHGALFAGARQAHGWRHHVLWVVGACDALLVARVVGLLWLLWLLWLLLLLRLRLRLLRC